jgi:G3E family GTPase
VRVTLLSCDPSADAVEAVLQLLGGDPSMALVVPGFAPPSALSASCSVLEVDPELAVLEHGCECCALRWDLVTTLGRLAARRRRPRRVVVVLDTDADVPTAVQTMLGDSTLRRDCVLDAVVHLMDVRRSDLARPSAPPEQLDRSLGVADHVILQGIGALDADAAAGLRRSLRVRARGASLAVTPAAAASVLDGRQAHWTLDGVLRRHGLQYGTLLAEGGSTVRWMEATLPGRVDADRLQDWLHDLGEHPGAGLLRLDGVFSVVGEPRPWVVLGVRTTIELGEPSGQHVDPRVATVRLVADGRALDPVAVRDGLADCCM